MFRSFLIVFALVFLVLGRFQLIQGFSGTLSTIADLLIVAAILEFFWGYRFVTFKAPIKFAPVLENGEPKKDSRGQVIDDLDQPIEFGVLRIRAKDVNISNLNNLFSTNFFGGGFMPGPTRQALVELTNPKVRGIERVSK